MLKLCCECIAGGNQLGGRATNEEPYGSTHLNVSSNTAPPWPAPRYPNEIMFILPRQLNSGDFISVTGILHSNPQKLVAGLLTGQGSPDYDNVAVEIEAEFPQVFTVRVRQDGREEIVDGPYKGFSVSDIIPGPEFNIKFSVTNSTLLIKIGDVDVHYMDLQHRLHDIRFISLGGDVRNIRTLEFQYAN